MGRTTLSLSKTQNAKDDAVRNRQEAVSYIFDSLTEESDPYYVADSSDKPSLTSNDNGQKEFDGTLQQHKRQTITNIRENESKFVTKSNGGMTEKSLPLASKNASPGLTKWSSRGVSKAGAAKMTNVAKSDPSSDSKARFARRSRNRASGANIRDANKTKANGVTQSHSTNNTGYAKNERNGRSRRTKHQNLSRSSSHDSEEYFNSSQEGISDDDLSINALADGLETTTTTTTTESFREPTEGYTLHASAKGSRVLQNSSLHDSNVIPGAFALERRTDSVCRDGQVRDQDGPVSDQDDHSDCFASQEDVEQPIAPPPQDGDPTYPQSTNEMDHCRTKEENDDKADGKKWCRSKVSLAVLLLLCLALGSGIVSSQVLGGGDDKNQGQVSVSTAIPTAVPTAFPTQVPTSGVDTSIVRGFVVDLTLDPSVWEDTNSPQFRALTWLARQPESTLFSEKRLRVLYALTTFYYGTNGNAPLDEPTWTESLGFLETTSECDWNSALESEASAGVFCDNAGQVTALYVQNNNLVGTIPYEIKGLVDLDTLVLGSNNLISSIPESMFELVNLSHVDLGNNALTGTIPASFVSATNLKLVHLGQNSLQGTISLSGLLENDGDCPLEYLDLALNNLRGKFPLERVATNCTNLTSLNLMSSGLSANTLPMFHAEGLTYLNLQRMQLAGSIPESIGTIMPNLQSLALDFNVLHGTLPTSLGELSMLEDLSVSFNGLEGTIPNSLSKLVHLESLDLSSNFLSGTVPSELAALTKLGKVTFIGNSLTGDLEFFCPQNNPHFETIYVLAADCKFNKTACSCCTFCA